MGNIEKKERKIHYVRTNSKDEREKIVETLENDGYKLDEEFPLTRQDVLESNLPVVVNSEKKVYSRMGNVTSAAAAAQSGKVIELSEFYSDFV